MQFAEDCDANVRKHGGDDFTPDPQRSLAQKQCDGERWYVVANFHGRSRAFVAFQVRLAPDLKEKLMSRSWEIGQSQGAIVQEALETYFANVAAETSGPVVPTPDEDAGQ